MGISYAIEGNECAGKSLLYSLTIDMLRKSTALPILGVREPGGTELGEKVIRPTLRDPAFKDMHSTTNTLLYTASRSELYYHREIPFLEGNPKGVLLKDRSWLSTIALQSVDGASMSYIGAVNEPFISIPDKFVIIDIPVEETVVRMFAEYQKENSNREPDWRDKQDIKTLNAIRMNYLDFAKNNKDRCMVFDCFDDPWEKAAMIGLDAVRTLLAEQGKTMDHNESSVMFRSFVHDAKMIVDTDETHIFSPVDKHVKTYDIEKYRAEAEVARRELGYPEKEELRRKMHSEWQMMGLEGNNSGGERMGRV